MREDREHSDAVKMFGILEFALWNWKIENSLFVDDLGGGYGEYFPFPP